LAKRLGENSTTRYAQNNPRTWSFVGRADAPRLIRSKPDGLAPPRGPFFEHKAIEKAAGIGAGG
jgi:hypothetical protein